MFALLAASVALACWRERARLDDSNARAAKSIGFVFFGCAAAWLTAMAIARLEVRSGLLLQFALSAALAMGVARLARHGGARLFATAIAALLCASVALYFLGIAGGGGTAQRSGWPIWHQLSYDFGVPALCLAAAAWLARPGEPDLATWRPIPAWTSAWLGLAAIFAVFAWLNVEVVNLCSDGPGYAFGMRRMPVRDVALSIAWTLYALALLAAGVKLDRSKLRWTSLGFLLAALGKVFLYDLGELRGLHRVASLVGLALALLAVSVVYQRFVFRRAPAEPPGP
jgi:uncharacterized membrane protein